jgi:hypothetical protein
MPVGAQVLAASLRRLFQRPGSLIGVNDNDFNVL